MNFNSFKNTGGRKEESEGYLREIHSLSRTVPFLSEKRVILSENTGFFKNKFEYIEDLFTDLPDFTFLIFVEKEISRSTKAFKMADNLGFCEEYKMPDDKSLIAWINNRLKGEGMTIERNALLDFIQRTKINMDNMDMELTKLISYCLGKDTITLRDVEEISLISLEEQIFNIVNAIANKDKKTALSEYAILYNLRSNPRSLLALLNNKFNLILNIKRAKDFGMNDKEIAGNLSIKNEYAYKKNLETARRFSEKSLIKIISMSGEYQFKMNTGLLGEQTGIELFIINSLKA